VNAEDTLSIISALKASGATHFKSRDFEITFGTPQVSVDKLVTQAGLGAWVPTPKTSSATTHVSDDPVANEEATKKLKEMIETLKLSDEQLMDKVFPAGAGG
jgi:hypothetical protein